MKTLVGLSILFISFTNQQFHCKALSPSLGGNDETPGNDEIPGNGCSCKGQGCICCVFLNVPKIHLNETGCVDVTYLPDEIGIDMKLTLNHIVLVEEKVSLRNPPPLCVGIPHLHDYASLCVVIYNVTYTQHIGACARIAAKLAGVTVEEINIGCFHFNSLNEEVKTNLFRSFYGLFKLIAEKHFGKLQTVAEQVPNKRDQKIIFEKSALLA